MRVGRATARHYLGASAAPSTDPLDTSSPMPLSPKISSPTRFTTLESPIGELYVAADDRGLSAVYFDRPRRETLNQWVRDERGDGRASGILTEACAQLGAYFRVERKVFRGSALDEKRRRSSSARVGCAAPHPVCGDDQLSLDRASDRRG